MTEAACGRSSAGHLRKPMMLALSLTLSVLLAVWLAISGARPASSLLLLGAVPVTLLLVRAAHQAIGVVRGWDFFSPAVAFPILYVMWFAMGYVDLIEVPRAVAFGLFEPIPGYVIGYALLGLAAYLVAAARWRKPAENCTDRVASGRAEDRGCEDRGCEDRGCEDRWREDREPEFAWREHRFWAALAALGVLMAGSYLYIIAGIGAIPGLSSDAGAIRLRILQFGAAEAVLFTCSWTLIPALLLYVWYRCPPPTVRRLCFAAVGMVSLELLSLGGRSYLFVPLLTTLVARHYAKRRFALGRLAVVGIALFCSLSLFGYVRDTSLDGESFGEDRLGIPGPMLPFVYAYLYVRYPVATFRDVTTLIPEKVPYQYGALSFGPLATVLPGHHEQSDMFFKNLLGSDFIGAGQPATLLGPLYGDAGWPGILVGLFLAGILVSRAYAWMNADPTAFRVLIYAWLMQTLLFSLFANLFPYFTTLWMPAFWTLLHLYMRKPRLAGHSSLPAGA